MTEIKLTPVTCKSCKTTHQPLTVDSKFILLGGFDLCECCHRAYIAQTNPALAKRDSVLSRGAK